MVFILHISLNESNPEIFRVIMIGADASLLTLHCAIQTSFGWTNSHLNCFIDMSGRIYGIDNGEGLMEESQETNYVKSEIYLNQILQKKGDIVQYIYDYGDTWDHTVELKNVIDIGYTFNSVICLDGEYDCPPEDVGGIESFYHMLEVLKDPSHDEYEDFIDWLPKKFVHNRKINLEKINQKLSKPLCGLPKWF